MTGFRFIQGSVQTFFNAVGFFFFIMSVDQILDQMYYICHEKIKIEVKQILEVKFKYFINEYVTFDYMLDNL